MSSQVWELRSRLTELTELHERKKQGFLLALPDFLLARPTPDCIRNENPVPSELTVDKVEYSDI